MTDRLVALETFERWVLDPPLDTVEDYGGGPRIRVDMAQRRTWHNPTQPEPPSERWSFEGHILKKNGEVSANSTRNSRWLSRDDQAALIERILAAVDSGVSS